MKINEQEYLYGTCQITLLLYGNYLKQKEERCTNTKPMNKRSKGKLVEVE